MGIETYLRKRLYCAECHTEVRACSHCNKPFNSNDTIYCYNYMHLCKSCEEEKNLSDARSDEYDEYNNDKL